MVNLQPWDFVTTVDLDGVGSPDVQRPSDNAEGRQSALNKKNVTEFASIHCLTRRNDEVGECLSKNGVDFAVNESISLNLCDNKRRIQWVEDLERSRCQ